MCRTLCIVHFTVITFTDTHYQSQVSKQVCAQKTSFCWIQLESTFNIIKNPCKKDDGLVWICGNCRQLAGLVLSADTWISWKLVHPSRSLTFHSMRHTESQVTVMNVIVIMAVWFPNWMMCIVRHLNGGPCCSIRQTAEWQQIIMSCRMLHLALFQNKSALFTI